MIPSQKAMDSQDLKVPLPAVVKIEIEVAEDILVDWGAHNPPTGTGFIQFSFFLTRDKSLIYMHHFAPVTRVTMKCVSFCVMFCVSVRFCFVCK